MGKEHRCNDCMFCEEGFIGHECAISRIIMLRKGKCRLVDSQGETYYGRENEYLAQCKDSDFCFQPDIGYVPESFIDWHYSFDDIDEFYDNESYDTDTELFVSHASVGDILSSEDDYEATSSNMTRMIYSPRTSYRAVSNSISNNVSPTIAYSTTIPIHMRGG